MLVAVLLNPPATTSGLRSRRAVERAASLLGYDDLIIVNLCAVPTPSVVELNRLDRTDWEASRDQLEAALDGASGLLAGWGVAGLAGDARRCMKHQIRWLAACAEERDIGQIWMVGGEPRHPSRWHQYVSDKYERTRGGTFEERLGQVLIQVPFSGTLARSGHLNASQRRSIQVSSSRSSQAELVRDFPGI